MGCLMKTLSVLVVLLGIGFGYLWLELVSIPDVPSLDDTYWGVGEPKPDDTAIKPFKISVSEADLNILMQKLNNTRKFTPPLTGIGFQYGFNTDYLNSIITYWKTEYKWGTRETFLNQFPQFRTQVSGLNIHFIHAKPDKTKLSPDHKIVPLLVLHGWPGSVREFYELIPLLTTPRKEEKFVFEVIAPSLPGYGFSDGSSKPGLGAAQVAVIMNKLMDRLGYKTYYVHGGDWGSIIGLATGIFYPERVKAYHSNMCLVDSRKSRLKLIVGYMFPSLMKEEGNEDRLSQQPGFILEETGYFHLQATKPDTIGVALTDSPAGLAAYILEKFSTWTNPTWRNKPDGGLNNYNKANLLDNVMIYWLTGSITSSMRLYSETMSRKHMALRISDIPLTVPTGCARFPGEILYVPKALIESNYPKLIRLTDMPKGGHFAAFEVPDLLAEDLWQFISTLQSKTIKN